MARDSRRPVHARHLAVHEYYIRLQLLSFLNSIQSIDSLSYNHDVLVALEDALKPFADHLVVIGNHYSNPFFHLSPL